MKNKSVAFVVVLLATIILPQLSDAALSAKDLEWRLHADKQLGHMTPFKRKMIATYRDRVEFFELPSGVSFGPHGPTDGKRPIALGELTPSKILWFSYPSSVQSEDQSPNILVVSVYRSSVPEYSHGTLGDFSGIISMDGEVVFKFPVNQSSPDRLVKTGGISRDGQYAEISIGRLVQGEDAPTVGDIREVWAWTSPDKTEVFHGPWTDRKLFEEFQKRKRKAFKAHSRNEGAP